MAARLATLGALGAEGIVLCMKKRWSLVSVSLKYTGTQHESLLHMLSCVCFFHPARFSKYLVNEREKDVFYGMDLKSFFLIQNSSETLRCITEGLHGKCVSEFWSHFQTMVTRCEATEPVKRLNESRLCSHRFGVASV